VLTELARAHFPEDKDVVGTMRKVEEFAGQLPAGAAAFAAVMEATARAEEGKALDAARVVVNAPVRWSGQGRRRTRCGRWRWRSWRNRRRGCGRWWRTRRARLWLSMGSTHVIDIFNSKLARMTCALVDIELFSDAVARELSAIGLFVLNYLFTFFC
jgi:hypothetical protein